MAISLRIEFISQVPLLKDIPAECPERTETRKGTFDGVAEHFTCVSVKAVDKLQANVTMKDGSVKELGAHQGRSCIKYPLLHTCHLLSESSDPAGFPWLRREKLRHNSSSVNLFQAPKQGHQQRATREQTRTP